MKIGIVLVLLAGLLSGCGTTTKGHMRGVFIPHFKSELPNIVSTPDPIREPVITRIKISEVVHE